MKIKPKKLMLYVWLDGKDEWSWVYLDEISRKLFVREESGDWVLLSDHKIDKIEACGKVSVTKEVTIESFVNMEV